MGKSCFLFGHRDCPDSILPKIEAAVKKHYELGVRYFYVGHRGRFDSLVTTAVKRAKEQHPDIRLYLTTQRKEPWICGLGLIALSIRRLKMSPGNMQ